MIHPLIAAMCGVVLATSSGVLAAEAPPPMEYEIVAHRGGIDDDQPIARPSVGAALPGGGYVVYSDADCRIHVLDADLRTLRVFGSCGEGPGDLERVQSLAIVDREIWAVMRRRISIFGLDGSYKRDRAHADSPLHRGILFQGQLVGLAAPHYNRIVIVDLEGSLPARELHKGREDDNLHLIGCIEDDLYYYGAASGVILRATPHEGTVEELDSGLRPAEVRRRRDGRATIKEWDNIIVGAWTLGSRIIVIAVQDNDLEKISRAMMDDDPDQAPWVVRVFRSDASAFERRTLRPAGYPMIRTYTLPEDGILVCDTWGSRLAVMTPRPSDIE